MHPQAAKYVTACIEAFGLADADVLDLGGRDVNGTLHAMFTYKPTVVDIEDGPGVTHVADAAEWMPPRTFGAVLCTEVFEHTPRWPEILHTAWCALRRGGILVATCATGNRPRHGVTGSEHPLVGEYYRNVDEQAVYQALEGWHAFGVRTADGVFGGDDLYVWAVR